MNRILMCLDYNDTIDNLIPKCADYESGGKFPAFFRGITAMSVATRSCVSIAIISSAHVDEIKEELNVINHYASKYCKLAIPDGENLINYIVGDKNQELYNYNTRTLQPIPSEPATKKEGVEIILGLPSEQGISLLITGGDSPEDVPMINAQTNGIPNVFIAPKANKEIINGYDDSLTIRDHKNNNSEGIGRCLSTLSKSFEEFNLTEAFAPKQQEEQVVEEVTESYNNNIEEITADFQTTEAQIDDDSTQEAQTEIKYKDESQIPSQQSSSSVNATDLTDTSMLPDDN